MGRTVSVKLMAEVSQFTREVGGRAVGAVKELGGELDKAAQKGKLDRLTTGTAAVGVGLLGIAAGAVKMRMDFDKSMSAVSAATHAPQDELDKLRNAAIKAGKDTQFSATAAADGITELGKAGVSTDDILSGGLKGALDLAAAGQLSVAEAAETSASALTQFKLQGSAVPHVADLLAAAAGKAQGSVHDMGYALNQSGLVASQFGLSIEDTTGVLGEFASAGLIGSDAGTSFKTMLLAMANPSDITKGKMDELGISFYDTQGKFIGLNGVAGVLQHTLGGLTEEQRNAALGQIFGNDAIRAATVLYKDGAQGVTDWKNKVNDSGYAASTAAKLTDNLAGDLERLKGSLETVAIQSGGGASDGLRKLTQGANGAVNAFADLPGWVQQSVTVLSGVGGASLLAAAGFLKARGTAKDFMDELRDMGPRGSAVATGLGKITGVAGKLGLVGVAAVGVYTGMKLVGDWVDHFTAPTVRDVDKMTDSLAKFAATGQATGELSKTFGANMSGLTRDLDDLRRAQAEVAKINDLADKGGGNVGRDRAMAALGGRIKDMTDQAKADLAALDQALANLVSNGNVTAAKTAFDAFARSTGLSLDKLPKYAAAAQNAATANTGLAAGFGDAKANADTMTQSLDAALEAGQKLTDVFDQLHGAVISVDKANLNAAQAIDAVREAFKANGKSVDESGQRYDKHGKAVKLSSDKLAENSEKALKNRVAVGQAAQAAAKAAEAKYEETGSVTAASKTYDHYIDQLRKTLGQSHLTKGEIDRLIHSYATMPPSVATKITAPGAVQAKKQIDEAHAAAKLLDGQYQIALKTTGQGKVESELRKLSSMQQALKSANTIARLGGSGDGPGFSGGGYTGPGARNDVAGVVHADEYVVSKPARQSLEQQKPGALDYMNQTGQWPGYAAGGQVWPFPVNASKTKVPEAPAVPGGGGGPGYKWMEAIVRRAFPGMPVYSDFRPGAITLTGNRSYHGFGRAVDFAPSKPLAEWINMHYMARTKELITPWQSLNIHNGQRHQYSALIENQHNFAGGNAHDHWAMANGGVIGEPVFGMGLRSGDTYSFGERGKETVTPGEFRPGGGGSVVVNISPRYAAGTNLREAGRQIAEQLQPYLAAGGSIVVRGQTVLAAG